MDDGLGVGIGAPGDPARAQFPAQGVEILDDPIMDHGDALIGVRVGVGQIGDTMGGPAGMPDPGAARQRTVLNDLGEVMQLAFSPPAVDATVDQRRDPGAVVAPVFEPTQPVEQVACDPVLSENADDATHGVEGSFRVSAVWRQRMAQPPPFSRRTLSCRRRLR